MPSELTGDEILHQLDQGKLSPFYLFYGENEFLQEMTLTKLRNGIINEDSSDFNFHLFYCEKSRCPDPVSIINLARTFPFLAAMRLIIVRNTEHFSTADLKVFLSYLNNPIKSTCLIFVTSTPDFRKKFFAKFRELTLAVNFRKLFGNQVISWIKEMARKTGLHINHTACLYLHQMTGNNLMILSSEIEKLYTCYGTKAIGVDEVKALCINSQTYTIFELIDEIALKNCEKALLIFKRFMAEEGKTAALRIIGMLNRQINLLLQNKLYIKDGGHLNEMARDLGIAPFLVKKINQQARLWIIEDLEKSITLLYEADNLIKTGSSVTLVLENVIISICKA